MKIYKIQPSHKIVFFGISRAKMMCDLVFTSESSALECLVHAISMALQFAFQQKHYFSEKTVIIYKKKTSELIERISAVNTVRELNKLLLDQNFNSLIGDMRKREVYDILVSEHCDPPPRPQYNRSSPYRPTTWKIVEIETDQLMPEKFFTEDSLLK
jgi:hypothetical protein